METKSLKRHLIVALVAAAALAAVVLTTAFAQTDDTYLVQAGDTAASIAEQFGITVEQLLAANALTDPAQVTPGTILLIPGQRDAPAPTPTPRGSTAGQASESEGRVFEAFPTDIPPTLTPTPLPYDVNRVVDLIEPDESQRFTVALDPVDIRGVVQFDPETMSFWKLEIRGGGRSAIGSDPMSTVPAADWVTLSTRTDAVIDGYIGTIPGYPTLTLGGWRMRVVAVNKDGTFAGIEEVPFRVSIDDIPPIPASVAVPAEGEVMQAGQPVIGSLALNFQVTSYRVELLGGAYTTWTPIANVANPPDDPIQITGGPIATLPADLPDGRYRLRLVINGPDGNYIQDPIVRNFAVGTDEVSNLRILSSVSRA